MFFFERINGFYSKLLRRVIPAFFKLNNRNMTNYATKRLNLKYSCLICNKRVSQYINKITYEKGAAISKCPSCNSLHLISDNIGFFGDKKYKLMPNMKE